MVDRIHLTSDYSISRIIKGGWHLAGGHGKIVEEQAIKDMLTFVEAGITTFDCADIYTGVEELIGKFLHKYKDAFKTGSIPPVQIHTKYVPDYNDLATLTKKQTSQIIERSLRRLGVDILDLVQFAWWDYSIPGYLETASHLVSLQKAGKIRHLGMTNFDGQRIREIVDTGFSAPTQQVQYSVMDHRVERDLDTLMTEKNMHYLCYGVLAGGFLTGKYLDMPVPANPLENRSLTKYKLIIDEIGGYQLYQELLHILKRIGARYGARISEVAMAYVMNQPHVAALIIGARNTDHIASLQKASTLHLDNDDLEIIRNMVNTFKGPRGPFYALERDKEGKHGRIMKYNLNTG